MNEKKSPLRVLDDQLRFLLSWIGNPLKTGAVAPSGKPLAAAMAAQVDPAVPGPIIELGPGTGPVTEALIERGIAPERIVALEYNADFAGLLTKRYPGITVIRGDAYALPGNVNSHLREKPAAMISSLPLFTQAPEKRTALVAAAFDLMREDAPFIQFTYALVSPVPKDALPMHISVSDWILLNVPPARVWTYRRAR